METKIEKEPTTGDILNALNASITKTDERFAVVEKRFDEVLSSINEFASSNEKRLQNIEGGMTTIQGNMTSLQSKVGKIEATMVTKDYLDEKLADMRGDINITARKEGKKLEALIVKMETKKLLTKEEADTILAMEPFPDLRALQTLGRI